MSKNITQQVDIYDNVSLLFYIYIYMYVYIYTWRESCTKKLKSSIFSISRKNPVHSTKKKSIQKKSIFPVRLKESVTQLTKNFL